MRPYLLAVAAALLLNLASEPVGWGFLVLVVLAPLMLSAEEGPRTRFLAGWLAGFLTQALGYYWIYFTVRDFGGQGPVVSVLGSLLFTAYQGLDLGLWLWLFPIVARRAPVWLRPGIAAACWYLMQSTIFPYVFPWNMGAFFTNFLSVSAALWTGPGLAFLATWAQGAFLPGLDRRTRMVNLVAPLILLLAGVLTTHKVETDTWRVAVIQPNLIRWAKRDNMTVDQIFEAHYQPSVALADEPLDLILWPETALAFRVSQYPYYLSRIRGLAKKTGAAIITGVISRDENGLYNAVHLYAPDGSPPQEYRKNKLVVFSERLPWFLSWATAFDPGLGGFAPGLDNQVFTYRDRRIIPLICYEALFPDYVSQFEGELMVNLTNDAWFGETKASRLHLQQIQLRTAELRTPLVRVTNSGISCWIDIEGQPRDMGGIYREERFIYEVPIPKPGEGRGDLARIGAWMVRISAWVLILVGIGAFFVQRRRGANVTQEFENKDDAGIN